MQVEWKWGGESVTPCPRPPHPHFTEGKLRPWEGDPPWSWQSAWTRAPDSRAGGASGSAPAACPGRGLVSQLCSPEAWGS